MNLKDLNFKHWWTMLAAAGGLIAVASIVPKSTIGFLIGLSLLFFGVGEWINRPAKPTKITIEGLQGFKVVDTHPWKFNLLGAIFDVAAIALFVTAAYMIFVVASQISR